MVFGKSSAICGVNQFGKNLQNYITNKVGNIADRSDESLKIVNFPAKGYHKFLELALHSFDRKNKKILILHEWENIMSDNILKRSLYKLIVARYDFIITPSEDVFRNENRTVIEIPSNIAIAEPEPNYQVYNEENLLVFGIVNSQKLKEISKLMAENAGFFDDKILHIVGARLVPEMQIRFLDSQHKKTAFRFYFDLDDFEVDRLVSRFKYALHTGPLLTLRNRSTLYLLEKGLSVYSSSTHEEVLRKCSYQNHDISFNGALLFLNSAPRTFDDFWKELEHAIYR